jgi:hypothetical protein
VAVDLVGRDGIDASMHMEASAAAFEATFTSPAQIRTGCARTIFEMSPRSSSKLRRTLRLLAADV